MKIYGGLISGNCYKIKLLYPVVGIDHAWIAMDIMAGACRTPAFYAPMPSA